CKGEQHYKAVLTEEQVLEILSLEGKVSSTTLADNYGVSKSTIKAIWQGVNWSYLTKRKNDRAYHWLRALFESWKRYSGELSDRVFERVFVKCPSAQAVTGLEIEADLLRVVRLGRDAAA